MDLTVNNAYVDSLPSAKNAINLFEGLWASKVPLQNVTTGQAALFEDARIRWLIDQRGGLAGANILELGPLEAGHTYMMERAGARSITAIEANSSAYLRCLIIKELMNLRASKFLLGDFDKFLSSPDNHYDVVVASGVLYHLVDPLLTLQNISRATNELFIWSHFFDEAAMPAGDPRRAAFTGETVRRELDGDALTYHLRSYGGGELPKTFCGGILSGSIWVEREEVASMLKRHGFVVSMNFVHDDHPNGPAACLYARRAS